MERQYTTKQMVVRATTSTLVTAYDNASSVLDKIQSLPKHMQSKVAGEMNNILRLSLKELQLRGVDVLDAIQYRRKPTLELKSIGRGEEFRNKVTVSIKKQTIKDLFLKSLDSEDKALLDEEEITDCELSLDDIEELVRGL